MTLEDVWDELHHGRVYECSLRDPKWHLDGLSEGGRVYVDPKPAMLETLVHELLHRRYPTMRERAVTQKARLLVGRMDEVSKIRFWKAYNRIKKRARPVDVED